jgi:nucleoside diphosphate kinase
MVATESLTSLIVESVKKAQNQSITFEEIYNNPTAKVGSNEFLFFIKPEILVKSDKIQLDKILELIGMKIEAFGFNIHNIKILSANYLDQYNIIAQHYGVINKISSNALANMSDGAKDKFKELTGKSINEVKVLGGSEFIEQYPNFNAYSLDYLWQNVENKKLAGGTYFEPIKVDDEMIYVINGFHPRQLKHFTEAGRSILVMTLSSNISWTEARSNFIGATNPNNANKGSLRREFLDNKDILGLAEVSQGVNGVHLSAGPVEALIELKRYNSNFADNNQIKDFSDYSFGQTLKENFNGQFEDIVNNINVLVDGKSTSIFDITEEKNSDEAIAILNKLL